MLTLREFRQMTAKMDGNVHISVAGAETNFAWIDQSWTSGECVQTLVLDDANPLEGGPRDINVLWFDDAVLGPKDAKGYTRFPALDE